VHDIIPCDLSDALLSHVLAWRLTDGRSVPLRLSSLYPAFFNVPATAVPAVHGRNALIDKRKSCGIKDAVALLHGSLLAACGQLSLHRSAADSAGVGSRPRERFRRQLREHLRQAAHHRAVSTLEALGYRFTPNEWKAPADRVVSMVREADKMHALLVQRADQLVGCTEDSR
jgi:hypothetical protein